MPENGNRKIQINVHAREKSHNYAQAIARRIFCTYVLRVDINPTNQKITKTKSKAKSKSKAKAKAKAKAKTKAKAKPKPKTKTKNETGTETKTPNEIENENEKHACP